MAKAETYKQEELISLPQMAVAASWFNFFCISKEFNNCLTKVAKAHCKYYRICLFCLTLTVKTV